MIPLINVSNGNGNNECNSNAQSITNDVNDHDYLNDSNLNNVNEELSQLTMRISEGCTMNLKGIME